MNLKIIKRQFLLLEMIIAMSLAVTVLSTLSYFYYQISVINNEMDKNQNENFERRYVENRLSSVIPSSLAANDASKDFHFFTSSDSGGIFKSGTSNLIFSFDNGVQMDKMMSYHVIGRLFLDQNGNLVLAKWPAKKRWPLSGIPPITKEILMQHVDSLTFSFFATPETVKALTDEKKSQVPPGIKGTWTSTWNKEYHELPAIAKVEITKKNMKGEEEKLTFVFPLPHAATPITYGE